MRFSNIWPVLKQTVKEWQSDNASQLAAALAYYTAVSIAPLLVILVSVASFFLGDEAAQGKLVEQLDGAVGAQAAEFIQTLIQNADQPSTGTIAGILSLLTLLWGASNVFNQLQQALNRIFNVELRPDLGLIATLKERLVSFSMVLVVAFLLLVSLVLSAVVAIMSSSFSAFLPGVDWLWQIVSFLVSLGVTIVLFAAIFKVLPDVKLVWSDVWVGATVTALLFTIGKFLLSFYLGNQGASSTYGAAGSLLVFLLWVFYSAQIIFLGAEFTQIYARRFGSGAPPDEKAIRSGSYVQQAT